MKRIITYLFITGFIFLNPARLLAQAPANDECSGAITVTTNPFGTTCTNATAATTVNATASLPAPSCAGSAAANDDVWYNFTAGSQTVILRISNAVFVPSGTAVIGVELYSGTCGSLSSVLCDGTFAVGNGYRIINGLTPGNIYYVRFWTSSSTNVANFNFCIQDVPAPPVNDECSNATPITVQPFGPACTAPISANTNGATHSTPDPPCGVTSSNDDIWYSFTATSASVILRYSNAVQTTRGIGGSLGYALYENSCPVANTAFSCINSFGFGNGTQVITGLTPGTTYYLRLFSGDSNNFLSFDFCVQEVPAPPVNDECSGAITITPEPYGGTCAASISANTSGATQSTPDPSCGVAGINDDIWYTFTATAPSIVFRFSNAVLTTRNISTALGYALYEGSCPASSTTIACDGSLGFGSGAQVINGLTPGNTYYLRLYSTDGNNFASFDFCIQDLPAPPANDECSGAIPISLTPFRATCSSTIQGNTFGGTRSSPNPSCTGSLNDDDVWYSFQATTATIILRMSNATSYNTGGVTFIGASLHPANCPVDTTLYCNNIASAGSGFVIINGLVPGNNYYLRFWEYTQLNYASFNFCVQEVPPVANDECTSAIAIVSEPVGTNCNASYSVTTVGATPSAPAASCVSNFNDDDVWYTFTANTSAIRINYSNSLVATALSGSANLGYALYEAPCPTTATTISCNNNIGNGSGSVLVGGLVPGQQYYLSLFTYGAGSYATFDFCVVDVELPLNDECINAATLTVSNGFCTNPVTGTLENSTDLSGRGPSSCIPTFNGNDVWYKLTVPATGNVIVQTSAVTTGNADLGMEIYSGDCTALTFITCDDNSNPNPSPSANHPRISLTGQTPGATLYIRILDRFQLNPGPFAICAWDSTATVPVSAGGNCISAAPLTIDAVNGNQYMWVPVLDGSGNIIAEIYPNGNALGAVNASLFVNSSGTVRNVNGHFYLDRNLTIEPSGPGSAKVRLYFTGNEFNALSAVDPTLAGVDALKINKVSTGCVPAFTGNLQAINQDTTVAYGGDYYLEFSTSTFSTFFIDALSGALPLEFLSFTANKQAAGNRLEWVVSKDATISHFDIQRSTDGRTFTNIAGRQQAAMDKEMNGAWYYSYTDVYTSAGTVYYRIKMTGINGKTVYSEIIGITATPQAESLKIYPNPVSRYLNIGVNLAAPGIRIQVMNAAGAVMKQTENKTLQNGILQLDLQDVPGGLYIVLVTETGSGTTHRLKVIKQ